MNEAVERRRRCRRPGAAAPRQGATAAAALPDGRLTYVVPVDFFQR